MAYDEKLAERIRKIIGKNKNVTEKKMFGSLSFLFNKKMFCGVLKDDLVLRLSHAQWEKALKEPHVRPMDFTGRPMRGFVYVNAEGCKSDKDLKKLVLKSYQHVVEENRLLELCMGRKRAKKVVVDKVNKKLHITSRLTEVSNGWQLR